MITFDLMVGQDIVGTVEVSEPTLVYLVRRDQPTLLLAGLDLSPEGEVSAGHWPDGEEWIAALRTDGVQPT